MIGKLISALQKLLSKVPWHKVPQFLNFIKDMAVAAAKYTAAQIAKVITFIKNSPGKIIDWFLKGWTAIEIFKEIIKFW